MLGLKVLTVKGLGASDAAWWKLALQTRSFVRTWVPGQLTQSSVITIQQPEAAHMKNYTVHQAAGDGVWPERSSAIPQECGLGPAHSLSSEGGSVYPKSCG